MSLKFGQIRPRTAELSALERLKNQCIIQSWTAELHVAALEHLEKSV